MCKSLLDIKNDKPWKNSPENNANIKDIIVDPNKTKIKNIWIKFYIKKNSLFFQIWKVSKEDKIFVKIKRLYQNLRQKNGIRRQSYWWYIKKYETECNITAIIKIRLPYDDKYKKEKQLAIEKKRHPPNDTMEIKTYPYKTKKRNHTYVTTNEMMKKCWNNNKLKNWKIENIQM